MDYDQHVAEFNILKPRVKALLLLPALFSSLASFVPLYFLGVALGPAFGIDPAASLRDQPGDAIFFWSLMAIMVLFIFVFAALGLGATALLIRKEGHSWSEIRDALLSSKYPIAWKK